ncbi:MAG: hypothetical protein IKU07_08665 [Oscillospiraceae bacterium]|nr:hypothetical protein [Oscillospiraceae bacterium]
MKQYLISLISAALISAVAVNIFDKKSFIGNHIRLLSGIFLSITVISPLFKLEIPDFDVFQNMLASEAHQIVAEGETYYQEQRRTVISQQVETYIVNKATELGAYISVKVTLAKTEPPIPSGVEIEGSVSPYVKVALETYMVNELGIPKERQMWN